MRRSPFTLLARSPALRQARTLLVIGVAIVLATLVLRWPTWQKARLTEQWLAQLETADEDRVGGIVDQLVEMGDDGIEPLATGLGSSRPHVTREIAAALQVRLAEWELSDEAFRSRTAARLAAALAAHVDDYSATGRKTAADVVQRILQWPSESAASDRVRLIADCERVLLATDGVGGDGDLAADGAREPREPPLDGSVAVASRSIADRDEGDLAALAALPGGNLPLARIEPPSHVPQRDSAAMPPATEPPADDPTQPTDPREPRLLLDGNWEELPTAPLPTPLLAPPPTRSAPSTAPRPAAKPSDRSASRTRKTSAEQPRETATKTGGAKNDSASQHQREREAISAREPSLLRLLVAGGEIANEAERQLRVLGYDDEQLAVARKLADADAVVRLRAAESLPRMAGTAPRRWLELLLDDEDATVRLAAFVHLATTGDAAFVDRLRRRASQDLDPTIRRQAERLGLRR